MIDSEGDAVLKCSYDIGNTNILLQEYNEILENLKEDLNLCKAEQDKIRAEIGVIRNDNKTANDDVRQCFSHIHMENCGSGNQQEEEKLKNLQEQIAVLQMEKDSVLQLWQIALKAVDVLEEELKVLKLDGAGSKLYEERIHSVQETYSEAIKALEAKLLQARENFVKQQVCWESSKEKINDLTTEKNEVIKKYEIFQRESIEKDRNNQQTIENLRVKLAAARDEVQKILYLKSELEGKLKDTKRIMVNVVAKDEETKSKMAEAIELVESAVREKDLILQREARILDEKTRVEVRLTKITEEHTRMLQEELKKIHDAHERNVKKYVSEIKELKTELRHKATLLDNTQKERKQMQEEHEKIRKDSECSMEVSNIRVLNLEKQLAQTELQFKFDSEASKKKSDMDIKHLEAKISDLQEQLLVANDRLKKMQQQNSDAIENQMIKQANEKTKDIMMQYTALEKHLSKSLDDKENLTTELKNLHSAFDLEIQRREQERRVLEDKIRDMEINIQKTHDLPRNNPIVSQLYSFGQEVKKNPSLNVIVEDKSHCCQSRQLDQINNAQVKFEKKIKELSQHVEAHRRLSRKWKEEAKLLATKFQEKSKEHRVKINTLRRENNKLNKELLSCKQQLINHGMQILYKSNEEDENR